MAEHYTIKASHKSGEFESRFGQMYKYAVTLEDREGMQVEVELNQKPETPEPMVDTHIYGQVEETQYGLKFKKMQDPDSHSGQSSHRSQGNSQPAKQSNSRPTQTNAFEEDERQMVIVRQNALTNANSNAAARSQVFIAQKKYEEAERVLKPSSIAFIQHWFYKASMGEWRMDMKVGDALHLMGFAQEDIDAFVYERQAEMEEQINEREETPAG